MFDQFNRVEQHLCDLNSSLCYVTGGWFFFVSPRQLSLTHHDLAPWHQCRCYLHDSLICMSLPSWSPGQELAACPLPSAGTVVWQARLLILKCCLWLSSDPTISAWERSTLSHSLHISDSQMTHEWHELAQFSWRLLRRDTALPTLAQPTPMSSYPGCAEQEPKPLLSSVGQPAAPRQPSGVLGEGWVWVLPGRNPSDTWFSLTGSGLYWVEGVSMDFSRFME